MTFDRFQTGDLERDDHYADTSEVWAKIDREAEKADLERDNED